MSKRSGKNQNLNDTLNELSGGEYKPILGDEGSQNRAEVLQEIEHQEQSAAGLLKYRWIILIISAIIIGLTYFVKEMPNALEKQIQKEITHEADPDNTPKYDQLYNVYYYPNIIMPLIGGILIDKLGVHLAMIIFSALVLAGQGVFTIAGFMADKTSTSDASLVFAIFGRIIYALGGECMFISQIVIVSKWFLNRELSLALCIVQTLVMVGHATCGFIAPAIADGSSLGLAFIAALIIAALALILVLSLSFYDKNLMRMDTSNFISGNNTEKFKCSDLKDFNIVYWLIVLSYFFSFSCIMFYEIINDFFDTRYGFTKEDSGKFIGIISMVAFLFSIVVAILCDKFGYRLTFCIIGTTMLTLSNFLFAVIPSSKPDHKSYAGVAPVLLLAIGINVYSAAKLPLIPIMIKSHSLGTALGLASCILNIGLSLGPFFMEAIRDPEKDENAYTVINIFMTVFNAIGIILTIIMFALDKYWFRSLLQKSSEDLKKTTWNYEKNRQKRATFDDRNED